MSSETVGQRGPAHSKTWSLQGFGAELFNSFRSIHLAIVLLSLLAVGTIIGVVMPQVGMVDIDTIRKQYGPNFGFYDNMGFFNVYSSFWFITLQILFFFNLLIGSFKWLKPATLAALQKTTLTPELLLLKPEVHSLSVLAEGTPDGVSQRLKAVLKKFRYGIHADSAGNLYASKGNISRLGPCISHLGILLCLIAGVYSSFTGFKAVRMAIPGETFSMMEANTFKTNLPEPLWLGTIPEWKIRVRDFTVEFYKDHPETAKQYYTKVDLLSPDGKVIRQETLSVNHPLVYDNISVYQASFAPTGRFEVRVNGKPMMLEVNSDFNDRPISINPLADGSNLIMFPFFAAQDPGVTENYAVFFIRKPGDAPTPGKMPENVRLTQGASGTLRGVNLQFVKPEMSTGLQMKRAPEVPLMYLSYIIISVGAALCFFSQRQVWLGLRETSPGKCEVMLYPKTNKGRISFQRELFRLEHALTTALHPPQAVKES